MAIEVDLRLDARWIVPVEPAGALERHALIADAGRIVALMPAEDADSRYAARTQVTLGEHALLPGLVNAHTHGAMTLLRGIADDCALKAWLEDEIWPRESRFVSPEFVHDGALLAAAEMLRGGVTCCNDMYFFPDAAARAYAASGMRALIGMPILEFPTPYAASADEYLQKGLAARDAWRHEPTLVFGLAPHAPYTVDDATWERIIVYARELDLSIQTHLQETRAEVTRSLNEHRITPLERLRRLGATDPGFIAVHAVHLEPGDIEILATQRCQVVHCPISNAKLASGIAPVAAMRARGINVALGTDGPASNNRLDLLGEARMASLLAKLESEDARALSAATALRMATLDGAKALGLEGTIGSLEPGKAADVVAVDMGTLEARPVYDPVSHLIHVCGRENVSDVWIAGRRVVESRRPTTIDTDALAGVARFWQDRLQ